MSSKENSQMSSAAALAIKNIKKAFGNDSIMRLGDEEPRDVDVTSTGSINIDSAIGAGGLPKGRIIEIYGPESSGKTTLTLHCIAECQKQGGLAAFIDAEHALDHVYAKNLGVDVDNLLLSQPDHGEQALEICNELVKSGAVNMVVIDSVAALTPKSEIEGDMDQQSVGTQARLMSKALRKITANISRTGCTVIFINQIRMKIGVMFGSPETTSGGNSLKFYSSVRMDIRRISSIKDGDNVTGSRTRVKVVKNKVAPPFRTCEFDIVFGKGICRLSEIIDLGVANDLIDQAGAWYSYNSEKIGQGKDNVRKFLIENPDKADLIEEQIRVKLFPNKVKKDSESN